MGSQEMEEDSFKHIKRQCPKWDASDLKESKPIVVLSTSRRTHEKKMTKFRINYLG